MTAHYPGPELATLMARKTPRPGDRTRGLQHARDGVYQRRDRKDEDGNDCGPRRRNLSGRHSERLVIRLSIPRKRLTHSSIAAKIGCTAQTLHEWVKKAERDSGVRAGVPTDVAIKRSEEHTSELQSPC